MTANLSTVKRFEMMRASPSIELSLFIENFRNGVWLLGIPSWLFGIIDRTFASFTDGLLSSIEFLQLFTAFFFFISWLYLKPEKISDSTDAGKSQSYLPVSDLEQRELALCTAQARMLELQEQHLISQEYILPFPYICQIYHLLNLKHLETIHAFSLNNLRVVKITDFQLTEIGGMMKFQTILDSPLNALRIWRQPIVEVTLILHTPYTVELRIPLYNDKYTIVLFNALPINESDHKFLIDIYSNLNWPKPLLQIILHFASCLTVFEDLPYLQKLAERNIDRLVSLGKISTHETMWLFRRFVELYGLSAEPVAAIES